MQVSAVAYAALGFMVVAAVPIRLPRGDTLAVAVGPALAASILVPQCEAVTGVTFGVMATVAVSLREDSPSGLLMDSLRYPIITFAIAGPLAELLSATQPSQNDFATVLKLLVLALTFVALDLFTYSLVTAWVDSEPLGQRITSLIRLVGGVFAGQASVGIALALVYPSMGILGALVLVVLMLVMKHTFGLYLRIRSAYARTVGVLARLAEFQLGDAQGHAERVAAIAAAMGRHMRLPHQSLERLSFAALLHDIGKVGTEGETGVDRHAVLGARILLQVPFLTDVAPVVAMHHDSEFDSTNPDGLLAQIVAVASRYDELRHVHPPTHSEELVNILIGDSSGYDSRVLSALKRATRHPQES